MPDPIHYYDEEHGDGGRPDHFYCGQRAGIGHGYTYDNMRYTSDSHNRPLVVTCPVCASMHRVHGRMSDRADVPNIQYR